MQKALEERLGEEVRVSVLGHIQRGGRPSAFDRNLGTLMGYEAVETILNARPDDEPVVIGVKNNRMIHLPLMESILKTQAVSEGNLRKGLCARNVPAEFVVFRCIQNPSHGDWFPVPHPVEAGRKYFRIAVLNAGTPAPGMNPHLAPQSVLGWIRDIA